MKTNLVIARRDMAPPYRNNDLLSVDDFLKYCTIRNINITKPELEYLDKLNLILPAVGYYKDNSEESHIIGDHTYILWSELEEESIGLMYSPYQVFCIKTVQDATKMRLDLSFSKYSQEDWIKLGTRYNELTKNIIPKLQTDITKYNKEFTFLYRLLDIYEAVTYKAEEMYRESVRDGYSKRENIVDFNATIKGASVSVIPELKKLLIEFALTLNDISFLQRRYVGLVCLGDPTKAFHDYLENVPFQKLEKATGGLRLALDSYAISDNFGLCVEMLGGNPLTLEYILSNVSDQKICPYCNKPYLITKKDKKTCGSPECVDKCKNEWKRDRYKEAKFSSKS